MKIHPVAIATIAVIGTAAALAVSGASASTPHAIPSAQLKINQRISQAAVLRSNQSLNYLAPIRTGASDAANTGRSGVTPISKVVGSGLGWTTAQIANGAVTSAKLANDAVTSAQIANGAVTSAKLANPIYTAQTTAAGAISTLTPGVTAVVANTGVVNITFPVNVSACTFAATIAGETPGLVTVAPTTSVVASVTVRTFNTAATPAPTTLPVQLIAYC